MTIATADDPRPLRRRLAAIAGNIANPRPSTRRCLTCDRFVIVGELVRGRCSACRAEGTRAG